MTPKVPLLPPLAVLLVAGALLSPLQNPAWGAEKPHEEKKEQASEPKAQVLQDLDRQVELRRSEVSREEERLQAARAALEAVKIELRKEYEKLEALKKDIEEQIARRDKAVSQRLDQIAKIYQSMKPKEAASALEEMDDDMALGILDRLPGRTVAKLFDAMPKERVRELTRRLEEGRKK